MILEPEKEKFTESEQSLDIKFAWTIRKENNYILQHWWVLCRDFLVDAVFWKKFPEFNEIMYNFKIDTAKFKLVPMLAVQFSKKQKHLAQEFINNLKYLHEIENKWDKTVLLAKQEEDNRTILVLSFSEKWMNSAFNISLYTFLIKAISLNPKKLLKMDEDGFRYPEDSYIFATKQYLPKVLEKLNELKHSKFAFNNDDYHNCNGFVSQIKHNKELLAQLQ